MTKPSYEELEPWQAHERRLLEVMMESVNHDVDKMDAWLKLYIAARDSHTEAENLRVRGLLQRVNVLSSRLWSMAQGMDEGGDVEELALQLETLAEQAESADIGKLDAADKSEPCLTHGAYIRTVCSECGDFVPDISKLPAGSAETGGEKA